MNARSLQCAHCGATFSSDESRAADCRYCGKALPGGGDPSSASSRGAGVTNADDSPLGTEHQRPADLGDKRLVYIVVTLFAALAGFGAVLAATERAGQTSARGNVQDAAVEASPDLLRLLGWPREPDAWADHWIGLHGGSFKACLSRKKSGPSRGAAASYELSLLFDERGMVQSASVTPQGSDAAVTACLVQTARMMGQPPAVPEIPKEGFTKVLVFSE